MKTFVHTNISNQKNYGAIYIKHKPHALNEKQNTCSPKTKFLSRKIIVGIYELHEVRLW